MGDGQVWDFRVAYFSTENAAFELVNRNTAVQRSGQQELQIIVILIYLH
jgi:hypothetical protein